MWSRFTAILPLAGLLATSDAITLDISSKDLLQTGRQPSRTSLLSVEAMDTLGKQLIQLCDQMEQHGLVDYQMGIWEEEILSGTSPPKSSHLQDEIIIWASN